MEILGGMVPVGVKVRGENFDRVDAVRGLGRSGVWVDGQMGRWAHGREF